MKKVLFVDCCIRREASRSKELAEYFIQKLEEMVRMKLSGYA